MCYLIFFLHSLSFTSLYFVFWLVLLISLPLPTKECSSFSVSRCYILYIYILSHSIEIRLNIFRFPEKKKIRAYSNSMFNAYSYTIVLFSFYYSLISPRCVTITIFTCSRNFIHYKTSELHICPSSINIYIYTHTLYTLVHIECVNNF